MKQNWKKKKKNYENTSIEKAPHDLGPSQNAS